MTSAVATPQAGVEHVPSVATRTGPVLVATDGTDSAHSALTMAVRLADRSGAAVTVLAVLEPLPLVAADYGLVLPPPETDDARRESLRERVLAQVAEVVGRQPDWEVLVRDGDPASVIARVARERDARVAVLGLGHHDLLDRMFGGETALHALRLARTPVLAVAPGVTAQPTRLAIALDFSEASVTAARAALALFPSVSAVFLLHVAPRLELQPEAYAAWMTDYSGGLEAAFAKVRAQLELPAGATVETMTLTGRPTRALLDFARAAHVDLLVTGSRGAGLVDRILVGSTATGLIRGAHCSVLAVPASLAPRTAVPGPASALAQADWAAALQGFSARNAGRLATLEVDDPEIGAQAQQHDYPFQGASYDHHDRRIEIMLGDQAVPTRHLTRGIADVRHVDLLPDAKGRDHVLRIAHGSGQTILTLVR